MPELNLVVPVKGEGSRSFVPFLNGRNGYADIESVSIFVFQRGNVSITTVSKKRGKPLRGGIYDLSIQDMNRIVDAWMDARRLDPSLAESVKG